MAAVGQGTIMFTKPKENRPKAVAAEVFMEPETAQARPWP